jgi:chaperonin GroEL
MTFLGARADPEGELKVVAGGGVALVRAAKALEDLQVDNSEQAFGVKLVRRAMEEPMRQISENAGWEGSVVLNRVQAGEGAFGFNARSEEFGDMLSWGVIDPTKVTRTALQNAASVASLLLTTEAMIADKPKKDAGGPAMPDMGGMDF